MGVVVAGPHPKCGRGCALSPLVKIIRNPHWPANGPFSFNMMQKRSMCKGRRVTQAKRKIASMKDVV